MSIGIAAPRIDARAKVTGQALYPGDLDLPGELAGKVLFAARPHARILSIDTSEAEALPGVLRVFTHRDVPRNEFGLRLFDQPVLCGEVVRSAADKVAFIVAESEAIAARARDLIQVEYEDLPLVLDMEEALAEGAYLLHPGRESNLLAHYRIRRGDVEKAFAQAHVVVEGVYETGWQEHAYLQPEAGLAYLDEQGRITVACAGQWTHEEQHQVAHALDLPLYQVRIIHPAIGGAFGGREDISIQIVLALAAWKLERPVKVIWSREESIIGHHKRHPCRIYAKWGATRDGQLVAAETRVYSDCGAYASTSDKVLGNTTLTCTGPYEIPNVKTDTYTAYTNNLPSGACRGFGAPQGAFAAESQMNKLAAALGLDPLEARRRNVLRTGSLLPVQTPPPGTVSMPEVLEACAKAAGWRDSRKPEPERLPQEPHVKRGIGLAIAFKNVGFSFGFPERCVATVELHGDGRIQEAVVFHAGADVGQGAHTVFRQMAAEALGLPLGRVRLETGDTAHTGDAGSSSASRMTFMAGKAISGAAQEALRRWRESEPPFSATYEYHPPTTTPFDEETGEGTPNFAYGYVAEAAEVEVDTETGQVRLVRVWCADDVGRAINPQLVVGQIEGGVVQAQGYAIHENFVMDQGRVLTPYLSNYLIPGVLDIPLEVHSIILEVPDDEGPWGARGMAEMPFIPLAPAITGAVHDATGVWIDRIPLTPDRVLAALRQTQRD